LRKSTHDSLTCSIYFIMAFFRIFVY